jgi:hypothetical protein
MKITFEEVESNCPSCEGVSEIYEDWRKARMKVLENLPFEKIHYALNEVDRMFESIFRQVLEFCEHYESQKHAA